MEASRHLDEVVSDEIVLPNPEDPNTKLYIVAIAKTLRDKSGQPLGVVTVLRDVTREKEISAMKANFLATVSHELRTPLTSIVSTFELLSKETLGALNQAQREFIGTSREQGKVLSEIIDNLLDLSILEAGKMELHPNEIDLGPVVTEAVKTARDYAQAKGLRFSLDIEPQLPPCAADKTKMMRLIKLLLSNAVKFTREGSVKVKLASTLIPGDDTRPEQQGIHFSVSDTGVGITKAHHTKVFEKFFQADNSITREFRGSGIGLPICKAIVDAHQGKIWLESELHKGTTFHVVLPLHQQ
jgi:signal transduction histidine kinase